MLPLINSFQFNKRARGKYNQVSHSVLTQYSHLELDHSSSALQRIIQNDNKNVKKVQKKMRNQSYNNYSIGVKKGLSLRKNKKTMNPTCYQNLKTEIEMKIILKSRRIETNQKPPHRYKTKMLVFNHCLFLYGGLGCEKNLTWAKLTFQNMSWEIGRQTSNMKPINTYVPCAPIYGHIMAKFKDYAVIYGGSCIDEINQTTIINTKNMNITQGSRCPFRRKQHAAVVLNDILIVHGGIESRQTKNQIFIYKITTDKWIIIPNMGLPALSSHKMTIGKNNREVYIFGGLDTKGKSVNKLYRIKNITEQFNQSKWEQIQCLNPPIPRHSFCFEKLSKNYLILYGGLQDNQTNNKNENLQYGVFNDIHTYNMEMRTWRKVCSDISLDYCFGMASTFFNQTIFIFGGSNHSRYSDASIIIIWNSLEKNDPWESLQNNELDNKSNKKISNKIILPN